MEIVAHALWAGGLAQLANRHIKVKHKYFRLKPLWIAAWAIFPDVVAFVPAWLWYGWEIFSGNLGLSQIPRHRTFNMSEPVGGQDMMWPIPLVRAIYHASHSIIIFAIVALLAVLLYKLLARRKALLSAGLWSMAGWLSHILIDVPSHSYEFSATPIFWPISDWKFKAGLDWGEPWFMLWNYIALFLLYLFLWYTEPRKKRVHWDNPLA